MNPHIPPDLLPQWLAEKVVDWWAVSRRQKHGRKAVWSERAFRSSLNRLVALYRANPAKADYLAERGLEHGWQALDPQFVEGDKAYQDIPAPANQAERGPLTRPGQVVTAADAERGWPERPSAPEALPWGVNRQGPAITMSPCAKKFDQANPVEAAQARQQIKDLFKIP